MDGENSQPCKHLPRPFCGALKQLPFLLGEMGRYGVEEMSRCPAGDKTKARSPVCELQSVGRLTK